MNLTTYVMCAITSVTDEPSIGLPHTVFVGILSIGVGTLLLILHPQEIFKKMLMNLSENGKLFENWREPNVHMFLRVYAFNITNAHAFLHGKEKLKMQEVGPYVYEEKMVELHPSFHHENGTITSEPRILVSWQPHLSKGQENDSFMLPNVAMLLFANKIVHDLPLLSVPTNILLSRTNDHPIIWQTLREFMFGRESTLVHLGHIFLPNWIGFEKLGILDRFYDQKYDTSTTFTGEMNTNLAGCFETYNQLPYLPQWDYPCDKLAGSTNGKKVGNNLTPNETVYIYRKGICRALPFQPIGPTESSIVGIPALKYKLEDNTFDNGEVNKKNKCFCTLGRCLPRGLFDISSCYYGLSLALSYPHFYDSDPTLLYAVEGLNPDPHLHSSYAHINQETGIVMNISIKIQINIVLGNMNQVINSSRFTNMVLPLGWVDVTMPKLNFELLVLLFTLLKIFPIAEMIAAFLFLTVGALILIRYSRNITYKYSVYLNNKTNINENSEHA